MGDLSVHEMTLYLLSEVNAPVRAALEELGPNRAGMPPIGMLGFMEFEDCHDLAKAADLAHMRNGTELWPHVGQAERVEDLARAMQDHGSWRRIQQTDLFRFRELAGAIQTYVEAKELEEEAAPWVIC